MGRVRRRISRPVSRSRTATRAGRGTYPPTPTTSASTPPCATATAPEGCAMHGGRRASASTGHPSPSLPLSSRTTHAGPNSAGLGDAGVTSSRAGKSRTRHAATAPSSKPTTQWSLEPHRETHTGRARSPTGERSSQSAGRRPGAGMAPRRVTMRRCSRTAARRRRSSGPLFPPFHKYWGIHFLIYKPSKPARLEIFRHLKSYGQTV